MNRLSFLSALALPMLLLGCGGSSGGVASTRPTVSLSSSAVEVPYGQPVTVTWSTQNADSVRTNFGASSTQLSGTLTDTPTSETTYQVIAERITGETAERSVTVRVTRSNKRILVIADSTQPGTATPVALLQSTTTVPVEVSLSLPQAFTADVLVLGSRGALTPSDWPRVRSFLSGGGGVVIVGRAAALLATGNRENDDISAIGNVLAGATRLHSNWGVDVVASALPGFPLSSTLYGKPLPDYDQIAPVSVNAIRLTTAADGAYDAFAYQPPIGGRVAYISDVPVDVSVSSRTLQELFLAQARWVAQ